MNSIACEFDIQLHGDAAATASILAYKPPGMRDLLPGWALESGRNTSRDLYRQTERVAYGTEPASQYQGMRHRQGWLGDAVPSVGGGAQTGLQPKRKAKAKPKPKVTP